MSARSRTPAPGGDDASAPSAAAQRGERARSPTERGYGSHAATASERAGASAAEPRAASAPVMPAPSPGDSLPLRAISRKAADELVRDLPRRARPLPEVQLRSPDHSGSFRPPAPVRGRLAPPRDTHQHRAGRLRDHLMWAAVALLLAMSVGLAIWLLAR